MSKQFLYAVIATILVLALCTLACGKSTTEKLAEAAQTPTDAVSTEPTSTAIAQATSTSTAKSEIATKPASTPTKAIDPTSTPKPPTPTPPPVLDALVILSQGFGQDERNLGYAFLINNPNPGHAFESTKYQVAAYDAAGTVVKATSGYIELLLPGQTLGIANSMYLDAGVNVAKIEVQISDGKSIASDPIPFFTTENVTYQAGEYFSYIRGMIASPYTKDITQLRVSAIAYDAAGEIIGGGFTYVNFVLANSSTGAEVSITSAGTVASVELYPTLSGLSALMESDQRPAGAENLILVKQGFGQNKRSAGFGMIIENPNDDFAIENTQYHVTAFAADGSVLDVKEGYIEIVLPSQRLGIGNDLYLDEGVIVDHMEIQIMTGKFKASDPLPFFATEKPMYQSGSYSSYTTGIITNPYTKDITQLRVSAIAYDAAGEIIGGGFTYVNFVLANSSTGVKVSVTSAGTVASVELYPTLSGLSALTDSDQRPAGAEDVILVKQGFGQNKRSVGFGMIIENPNDDFAIEDTQYHLTAFAADGSVLDTEEGYIKVILPSQTLGIGNVLNVEDGVQVARIDIQIKTGDFESSAPIPPFTAESVTYQAGSYSSKALGTIVSPYSKDITQLRVSAILYNASGEIIGGGFTFLNFAPANGKAAVEVSVTSSGTPASLELYATVSSLSDYK